MRPPDVAGVGPGVGRLPIGGEVSGHAVFLAAGRVAARHVEPEIGERIRVGGLPGPRPVPTERNLVPLLQFPGDLDATAYRPGDIDEGFVRGDAPPRCFAFDRELDGQSLAFSALAVSLRVRRRGERVLPVVEVPRLVVTAGVPEERPHRNALLDRMRSRATQLEDDAADVLCAFGVRADVQGFRADRRHIDDISILERADVLVGVRVDQGERSHGLSGDGSRQESDAHESEKWEASFHGADCIRNSSEFTDYCGAETQSPASSSGILPL